MFPWNARPKTSFVLFFLQINKRLHSGFLIATKVGVHFALNIVNVPTKIFSGRNSKEIQKYHILNRAARNENVSKVKHKVDKFVRREETN